MKCRSCSCCGPCSACAPCEQSRVIKPVLHEQFQVRFKGGDRSYREDVFNCIAADDRTVVGEFLTRGPRYGTNKPQTAVFQREEVEFFLNGYSVRRCLLDNKRIC